VNETGISTVQNPGRVVGPKEQKLVGAVISWERGKKVAAVCSISASANHIPPMLICPRKPMSLQLQWNGRVGASILVLKMGGLLRNCSLGSFITNSSPNLQGISLYYYYWRAEFWVRFPARAGNFFLYNRVQKGCGVHPASYPVGTRGSFPGGKAAGA
jgi:hypothetical protein